MPLLTLKHSHAGLWTPGGSVKRSLAMLEPWRGHLGLVLQWVPRRQDADETQGRDALATNGAIAKAFGLDAATRPVSDVTRFEPGPHLSISARTIDNTRGDRADPFYRRR